MEKIYDEKTKFEIGKEFQRLKGQCYLDHAGATLYSETQIRNICLDLCSKIFGNPHSLSLHSQHCTEVVEEIRNRILNHFHTDKSKYSLIFTSGATAAIKLLFENFDWDVENDVEEEYFDAWETNFKVDKNFSAFIYTQSNHTSILGAREFAAEKGVHFFCLGYDESFSLLGKEVEPRRSYHAGNSLFAYPAQCNFSGRKYPLEWIWRTQNGALDSYGTSCGKKRNTKWFVLLDAATYCSTNDLDLSILSPDFVCLSFYKMFGYPTGLGALLVRNSSAYTLRKTYFGGGTVEISLAGQNFHQFRSSLHERFEDGTISFLSIIALDHGLKTLKRLNLNMRMISQHTFNLAKYTFSKMKTFKHWNNADLVKFYADSNYNDIRIQGGIINLNFLRSDGRYIGFAEVLHIANLHNIQFRTGCFCNSGACQRHLGLTDQDLKLNLKAGHICGDNKDLINGKPTGSIRISFGYMTTFENIDEFMQVMKESFLETVPPSIKTYGVGATSKEIILKKIWAYPIKSCAGMEVKNWKLNERGLEYDREWMIITESGTCLTQKQEPKMSLVVPKLDLEKRELLLTFRTDNDSITIPIDVDLSTSNYDMCTSKICGDQSIGYDCGNDVANWLCRHLNKSGLRLIKQSKNDQRKNKVGNNLKTNENEGKLSFANQAQYLLINHASVSWLLKRIEPDDDFDQETLVDRFRSNFLIDGAVEFSETNWSRLCIGSVEFRVEGPCGRCHMICIDQRTGAKSKKPLVALGRALNNKLRFGIYLSRVIKDTTPVIRVGEKILVYE